MNGKIKAGVKTSEFWASLAASVFGVLTILGVVGQAEATEAVKSIEIIAGSLITAVSTGMYALSRGKAKE